MASVSEFRDLGFRGVELSAQTILGVPIIVTVSYTLIKRVLGFRV